MIKVTGTTAQRAMSVSERKVAKREIGDDVRVVGMVHSIKNMGKFSFLSLRVRDGLIQCVADNGITASLKNESAVEILGDKKEDARAKHGFEIHVRDLRILSAPKEDMPVNICKRGAETGIETDLTYRPATLRGAAKREVFRLQAGIAEAKRMRFVGEMGITPYDAVMLTTAKQLSDLFEQTSAICKKPKEVANLIIGEIMRLMNDTGTIPEDLDIDAVKLADIIMLTQDGVINRSVAKTVLEELFRSGADPRKYIERHGLAMVNDDSLIEAAVDEALVSNPKSVEDYRAGKEKAFGFLVGQTMKILGGKGDPQIVNRILREKFSE